MPNCAGKNWFRLAECGSALLLFVAIASGTTLAGPTDSASGAEAYFIDLKDGAKVPGKLILRFGLRGMGIAPAGEDLAGEDLKKTGHHHLLIDAELPPLDKPIPDDANHLHFDAGQTEAEITLSPGTHTLQLLLGDKDHVPHNPAVMSPRIRVIAGEGEAATAPSTTAPVTTTPTAPTTSTPTTTAPAAKRQLPSPDALRRRMPERFERYMPDPRDFRR